MFGIGFPELLLILALALIVVGPDKLPDLARSIAKTLVDLKKTAEGLKDSFEMEDNPINDIKPKLEDAAKNFKESVLDADTPTWNVPEDLEELTRANTGGAAEQEEEWQRDEQPADGQDAARTGNGQETDGKPEAAAGHRDGEQPAADADDARNNDANPPEAGEKR